ncbi:MAG: anti-sigma factor [Acidimicrobiia bacterium]|nr:anti-sigma factor [Acidimicrobiia bacterium]
MSDFDTNPEDSGTQDVGTQDVGTDGVDTEHFDTEHFDTEDFDTEDFDTEIMSILSELTDDDRERLNPPPFVWNAIADTVASDRDGHPNRELTLIEDNGAVLAEITPIERRATTTIALNRPSPPPAIQPSSAWRQWLPVAAAIGVAIAGGLVTWAFSGQIVDSTNGEIVAAADITNEGLPVANDASGRARLTEIDGAYQLELDVPDLPDADGFYEVWIIDTDVEGMYSLGVVTGDATFTLPPNIDPADYPVIDVSVEPADGDPTHSGQSIWRGVLGL